MSRRLLLMLGGALLLILIVVGILLVLQRQNPESNTNTTTNTGTLPNVNTVVVQTNQAINTNTATTGTPTDPRTEVQNLAKSFASIYGSFSNQNNFENITQLYFYMAPDLQAQQEAFVAAERAKRADTSLYTGTASVASIAEVQAFDATAGTAQVRVTLQRNETSGSSAEPNTYYQDITLSFQRMQGIWKVARIAWGAKQ